MNEEELQELKDKIEDLETRLEASESLSNEFNQLEDSISRLDDKVESYQRGDPGIKRGRIILAQSEYISLTDCYLQSSTDDAQFQGFYGVGNDLDASNGSDNAQVVLQHHKNSTLSFLLGQRKPIFIANDGFISTGGNTLSTTRFTFETDDLVGATLLVRPNGVTDTNEVEYTITSNTANIITASSASWDTDSESAYFIVYRPIYLGSGSFPWQRVYGMEGTGGGLRFGVGPTGSGQNGLLYMDSTGDLYWRNKSGTSTKLN